MRVEITDGCWTWKGYVDVSGYGIVNQARAHRVIYEIFVGRIPPDYHVHHHCGNKRCVNPAHLEALQVVEHRQAHSPNQCVWGHAFDDANTYITSRGHRQCRKCKARRERERQRRLRLGYSNEHDVGVTG